MRLVTSLLGELGASIKKAIQGPHETDLTIPPIIQPIIGLRNVHRVVSPPVATEQNTTFQCNSALSSTNQAQQAPNLCTIGPGLWELNWNVFYSANHASGFTNGLTLILTLGGFSGQIAHLSLETAAGGVATYVQKIVYEFDTSVTVGIILSATGVGQTHTSYINLHANRLL